MRQHGLNSSHCGVNTMDTGSLALALDNRLHVHANLLSPLPVHIRPAVSRDPMGLIAPRNATSRR